MRVVMTGGSKGIGLVAAQQLLAQPGVQLLLGVNQSPAPAGAKTLPLKLDSLTDTRRFAADVVAWLAGARIDALLLNAGGQRPDVVGKSADGHELTFAINHLAPYLLVRLLLPHMAPGGAIIITASGTHDPAEKTGLPPPYHAHAAWLADPAADPQRDARPLTAGLRAYCASKLCNVLTVRQLAALPAVQAAGIRVMAYDPGLTPGTGLAQRQHWAVRTLVWPLLPLLVPFGRHMNHLADSGGALAALATTAPPPGRVYAALRKGRLNWPDPSELARDDAVAAQLWADSARLCGLPD
ncbi:MAG: SDR family NAD(P)-dependent oxidoreductase [Sphingomonadales bacterium]|jgi:NAD(P)-dependent dehydrogenase (short-subunit alcohol dehydrogenase family)